MSSIDEIRNLIAQSRLGEALDKLAAALPARHQTEVIQLKGQFNQLNREKRLGILNFNDASIRENRIISSVLELCDMVSPADAGNTFDAATTEHLNAPMPAAPADKTKILFLAANPTNASRIQTDKEYQLICAELERGRGRDRFEFLSPRFAVTVTELVRAMNDKPNIVHFSGHGSAGPGTVPVAGDHRALGIEEASHFAPESGIIITNDDNLAQPMPIQALQRLFKPLKGITSIVILNACYSAAQAETLSKFGMYVVGNNLPISDPAAISFSQGFYNGLGEGKDFENAFNDAMTVVLTKNPGAASVIEVWKDGIKLDL